MSPEPAEPSPASPRSRSFATLGCDDIRVRAQDLIRIQLLRSNAGEAVWVELFFQNGDYVLQKVQSLTFFRRDGKNPQARVTVNATGFEGMSFPVVN